MEMVNLTPDEKLSNIDKFLKKIRGNYVAFGELLSDIKRSGLFKSKGYRTFKTFIESEHDMTMRAASNLIQLFELYAQEYNMSEADIEEIGIEKLNMISSLVQDVDIKEGEQWINEAKKLNVSELREQIKESKEKSFKPQSFKELFVKQFHEKWCVYYNCTPKELSFKLAVYFQDVDMAKIKAEIKIKQEKLELE